MGGITVHDSFFLQYTPSGTSTFIGKSSKIYSKPASFVNATMQGENKKEFYIYNAPNHLNPFQQERMCKSGRGYIYANKSSHKRQKERHDKGKKKREHTDKKNIL
jgi:hypothetical protein